MIKNFHTTVLTILAVMASAVCSAQNFINPILPGAHPDPSVCRVGDDFYIVNSTFEYFPGLPISHSKDLINWELIGYGLHKESQCGPIGMFDIQQNGGIHAPTIRYHDGTFYIIVTSMYSPIDKTQPTIGYNFIITAENPEGPWSDPHIIEGAIGIDPDIFFDDNGKVWYIGTCSPGNVYQPGIGEIWGQELDLDKWELKGERYSLWNGACGGFCAEGPHMYKKDGLYYLMIAEGGTGLAHSEVISVSKEITGPFESNLRNPIMTSRHLGYSNWINSTGHADLVELEDGRWYMVCLGMRNECQERRSNMGRETNLLPVIWERDVRDWMPDRPYWPVCAPETGRVERYTPVPFKGTEQFYNDAFVDNFDSEKLDLEWNFRRCPKPGTYSLTENPGSLRLYLSPETMSLRKQYSFMGILQKESNFEYAASMKFSTKKNEAEAGISLCQGDENYINWTVKKMDGKYQLMLSANCPKKDIVIEKQEILNNYEGHIIFKVVADPTKYSYYYSLDNGSTFQLFTTTRPDLILCYGYSGARLGVYATSNGKTTKDFADFDWVRYQGAVRK